MVQFLLVQYNGNYHHFAEETDTVWRGHCPKIGRYRCCAQICQFANL